MEARESFVRANGLRHHVVAWGDPQGTPVVLLHGFLDHALGFAQLGPALARRGLSALAVSFRGHGETERVPEGGYYHFPDYLLDLHLLLPQLTRAPLHLVGHSMGSTVAAMFAATHPQALRSLTLIESLGALGEPPEQARARLVDWLEQASHARAHPAQLRDSEEAYERLARRHAGLDEGFLRMLAARSTCAHPSGEGLTWRFDPLHRTRAPVPFDPARFVALLASIEAPTLVIQAERGYRTPDHEARLAALPNASRALVAGAGHMVHWSHCGEVEALLMQHFASCP